jgi:hypothetical protein
MTYLLRVAIIQGKIISMKNSVILATNKNMYTISYISNEFIPQSLKYFNNNTEGRVLYQCILLYRIK